METDTERDVTARLAQLREEVGDPDIVVQAVEAFLSALDQLVDQVTDTSAGSDRRESAHRLAGSAETLGAVALGLSCRVVMRAHELDGAAARDVRETAAEAAAVMTRVLPGLRSTPPPG